MPRTSVQERSGWCKGMTSLVDAADAAALTEVGVGYGLVVDDNLQLTISIFSDTLSYHFSYINDSL